MIGPRCLKGSYFPAPFVIPSFASTTRKAGTLNYGDFLRTYYCVSLLPKTLAMATSAGAVRLPPESAILSPLPLVLHQGLTAVAVLAGLSFLFSSITVTYLTVKLVRWHLKIRREAAQDTRSPEVDLSMGLAPRHFGGSEAEIGNDNEGRSPNQFLILLYNLLIADMHQSASFLINGVWVGTDTLQVGSPACFIQGWLVSTGDVAGGLFLSLIAMHTYLAVVWNRKPAQWTVYSCIILTWVLTYFISAIGIATTRNGQNAGGWYVRAGAWVSNLNNHNKPISAN